MSGLALSCVLAAGPAGAQIAASAPPAPLAPPDATIDLATRAGVDLMGGQWRYSDAAIETVPFRGPGPDRRPTGAAVTTQEIAPAAGAADFDDSRWRTIAPETLEERRGNGKLSFAWYRIAVTIPQRVGKVATRGTTAVFEIVVDDYAEVWVDGRLSRDLGQHGGSVIAGFNVPNRVVLKERVEPGDTFLIAVFAANGPMSAAPENFIWVRSAKVHFHAPRDTGGQVLRLDPAVDVVVPSPARIERLAQGFQFTEGPVWDRAGSLLFSDPNKNRIYRWTTLGELSIFRDESGYSGADIAEYHQPGSNGLTFDPEGRLTINEHGNRRVTRLEKDGRVTVLADRYDGKRLNSPNDLVYRTDGSLYFTDPPFGLPKVYDDPGKELPYSGIFLLKDGKLTLLARDLKGPNGLAFSPDETFLYVTNWDLERKIVMRYPVKADGTLGAGQVFFDMTGAPGEEALDGVKVDRAGNLFVSGPGGVWILSAEGKHLGTIVPPELPANMIWGDDDGRTLYMTARTGLYRIRLTHPGVRP